MNPFPDWTPLISWIRTVEHPDGRTLSMTVAPARGSWIVMVLEYATSATPSEVFDQHAHKLLGNRKSEAAARRLAARYAEMWLALPAADPCECKEIAAP